MRYNEFRCTGCGWEVEIDRCDDLYGTITYEVVLRIDGGSVKCGADDRNHANKIARGLTWQLGDFCLKD